MERIYLRPCSPSWTVGTVAFRAGQRSEPAPPPTKPRPSLSALPLPQNVLGGQDQLRIRVTELEDEVRNLRKINRDLFDFSTRIITHPTK